MNNQMARKRRLGRESSPNSSRSKYEGRGDDVMVARDRLKGALHDLIHSDEESSSSQDETISIPTPSKITPIKKELKPPAVIRRRKRKLPVDLELAFQHTFVMKLFDRSVDLAQFKEDTPLYPICRAWMANQPRVPPPYPPLDSPGIKEEAEELFQFDTEEITDVYKLPGPSNPPWSSRIPPVSIPPLQGIKLDYNSEILPTADELLNGHVKRWGKIRKQWVEASQTNERRFQESGKILCNIYKRAQSAFNM